MPGRDPLTEFRLDGDVAVVTGGASGIGRVVADAFAAVGAKVAVFDIAAGGDDAYTVDVADEAQVNKAFADVVARHGGVDILFNNAGIAIRKPTTDLTLDDWNKVVAVNMTGVFLCAREAARHMRAARRGGRIVNTASIMGFSGGGLYPNISYQATKGAVVNMTRALAIDCAPLGIRVNCLCPGPIETPMLREWFDAGADPPALERRQVEPIMLKRLGRPDEMASVAVFLASDASSYMTGSVVAADGGATAWYGL
jgi:NAD(P)-dependent dehydrogenase (short-subunit alcohol dehydrogenase family)